MICPHCNTIITPQTACEKLDTAFYDYQHRYGKYPNLLLCTLEFKQELYSDVSKEYGVWFPSYYKGGAEKYRTMLIEVSDNVKLFKVGYIE